MLAGFMTFAFIAAMIYGFMKAQEQHMRCGRVAARCAKPHRSYHPVHSNTHIGG